MDVPHTATAEGTSILLWVLWIIIGLLCAASVWLLKQFYDGFTTYKKDSKESIEDLSKLVSQIETKLNDNIVSASVKMNQALGEVQKAAHTMKIDTIAIKSAADKFEYTVSGELAKIKREITDIYDVVKKTKDTSVDIDKSLKENKERVIQVIQAIVNLKNRIDVHDNEFKSIKLTIGDLTILKSKKVKNDSDEG
jgi:hypothetical protein